MENSNNSSTSIKTWAPDDKPREKLMTKGRESLSDSELLAILIRTGSGKDTAVDLAKKVLQMGGNDLNELGRLSVGDLMTIKGIGEAKAVTIIAALEVGRRRQSLSPRMREKFTSSKELGGYLRAALKDYSHEVFGVVFLNRALKLIQFEVISKGGMSQTVADPRVIFKRALDVKACTLVLCHNHPSGNLKPSEADRMLTERMVQAGKLLDVQVLDHLIVSEEGYYSFADEGLI